MPDMHSPEMNDMSLEEPGGIFVAGNESQLIKDITAFNAAERACNLILSSREMPGLTDEQRHDSETPYREQQSRLLDAIFATPASNWDEVAARAGMLNLYAPELVTEQGQESSTETMMAALIRDILALDKQGGHQRAGMDQKPGLTALSDRRRRLIETLVIELFTGLEVLENQCGMAEEDVVRSTTVRWFIRQYNQTIESILGYLDKCALEPPKPVED
jgi:hypothetical protein